MPFVAYPPNPPAVGHPDTIGARTALYFIMLAISVIAAVTAVLVGRELAESMGRLVRDAGRHRRLSAGDRQRHRRCCRATPKCRPTSRPPSCTSSGAASLITQLALWATLGVALGELLHRLQRRYRSRARLSPTTQSSRSDVISPPSPGVYAEARRRLDALAKPVGALGRLEDLAAWVAACQGDLPATALGPGTGGDLGR